MNINSRLAPPFNPALYHFIEVLPDNAFGDVVHARLVSKEAPIAATSSIASPVAQRCSLRRRKRAASSCTDDRPAKLRKLRADRRFVIFIQSVIERPPSFTKDSIERIDHFIRADPEAEFFFVFATPTEVSSDLGVIPMA